MKKILSILLTLSLLLVPALALGEGEAPEAALVGDWYGELNGLVLQLTLNEDGTYAAALVGSEQAAKTGAWVLEDGFIYLDGALLPQINVLGDDVLKWTEMDIFLRREQPWVYAPADPFAAPAEFFDGYWRAQYLAMDGAMLFAEDALGEVVALYIEGQNVALGGDFFGNAIVEMAYADGALSLSLDGQPLTLQLQQDGFLRLTLTTGGEPLTLYFTLVPAEAPEA